jgi:hypothetical protein
MQVNSILKELSDKYDMPISLAGRELHEFEVCREMLK